MEITDILIVDDDPVNLAILEKMLNNNNLAISQASSGFEALELASKKEFALGLIDVQMPGMNGFEAAEKLRQTPLNEELPVIFISAISKDKQFVTQGYESGAVDYMIKPFDHFLLKSKVNIFCQLFRQKKLLEDKNCELAKVNIQLQKEISERKKISKKLKNSETRYRKLFEKSNDAILITDKLKILDCNTAFMNLYQQKSKTKLLKMEYTSFFPEKQEDGEKSKHKIAGMVDMAIREGSHEFEAVNLKPDGTIFYTESLITTIPMGKEKILHVVIRDITKRKASEKILISQATRDPLTSLFNRRYLEESLEREISKTAREKGSLAVIMLDADHFKLFNDTYGHLAGDVVLRNMGMQLVKYSRKEDIACRYGGEEFVLVLPGTSLEVGIQRAEDLRLTFEKQKKLTYKKRRLPNVTVSLGVALMPIHGKNMSELMNAADKALYKAKELGRNKVVVANTWNE